ncbi:DNA methylase, partial [Candidatus Bathyarchaeota archaeon]|nr:DNA methylase [Candidatus Bathyarchaeota archaeon]
MQGQLFACTTKTKDECFERLLFGTNRAYAPAAMRVRKGHYLFLLDLDSDLLYGVFRATSEAKMNIEPSAWQGKYPYQVEVEP